MYTSRPPTGVDLALGLSGYDKLYNTEATTASHREVRTPTTLQAYKDEDEEMKRRVASLDAQEAKWQRIKAKKLNLNLVGWCRVFEKVSLFTRKVEDDIFFGFSNTVA